MSNSVKVLIALAIFAGAGHMVLANPANPAYRTYTQPDGSTFTARLIGDEHYHFYRTSDGYSLAKNVQGYWTYAKLVDGLIKPSEFVVGHSAPQESSRKLYPNPEAVAAFNAGRNLQITLPKEVSDARVYKTFHGGVERNAKAGPTGTRKLVVITVQFSDTHMYNPSIRGHFNAMMFGCDSTNPATWSNGTGNTGSPDSSQQHTLNNYYWEMTYGKVKWKGYVTPSVYTLSGSQSYYGGNTFRTTTSCNLTNTSDCKVSEFIQAAITAADADVDFSQFDNVAIAFAGSSEDMGYTDNALWSLTNPNSFTTNEGNVSDVTIQSEMGELGVYCHEMFHALGGPDLYDYGYGGNPWGDWSLMDRGSWNGNPGGSQPSYPGGHLMYELDGVLGTLNGGWWDIASTYSDSITRNKNGDGCYRVAGSDSFGLVRQGDITGGKRLWITRNKCFLDSSQWFFIENRTKTGSYESGLPEEGLIISHIDTRMEGLRLNDGPASGGTIRCYYSFVETPGFDPNEIYASWTTQDTVTIPGIGPDIEFLQNGSASAYSANDYNLAGYAETAIDSLTRPDCRVNCRNMTTFNSTNRFGPGIYDISQEGPVMSFNVRRVDSSVAAPMVSLQSYAVNDSQKVYQANNNNKVLDPWERDSIKATFFNAYGSTSITAGAQCSLYVVDGGAYVSVTPAWKTVGTGGLNANATAESQGFEVNVSKSTPRFLDIRFAAVFKSTTPSYRDTSYFTARISPLKVDFIYDFRKIYAPYTSQSFFDRIQPTDCAVWRDTLYVTNSNNAGTYKDTRIYRVKKNTTNFPLVGGLGGDTLGSFNNRSTMNSTAYSRGIDCDASGRLCWQLGDSIWTAMIPAYQTTPAAPNVPFALPTGWMAVGGDGTQTVMRGIAFGPPNGDTVGGGWSGDSCFVYYQRGYHATSTADNMWQESVYCVRSKFPAAPFQTAIRFGRGWNDSMQYLPSPDNMAITWGASYGGDWWNGRALEYDGSFLYLGTLINGTIVKKDVNTGKTVGIIPGPSYYGTYGIYGFALEATDSLGVAYQPTGSVAFAPEKKGTRYYLYCAAMDDAKIYKIDLTDFTIPTGIDSMQVSGTSPRKVKWWKSNAQRQKIRRYIIYGRNDANAPLASDSINGVNSSRIGGQVALVDSFLDYTKGGKAYTNYTIVPVNYSARADFAPAVYANPLSVQLVGFVCNIVENNGVDLRWQTASESDLYQWTVERSVDGVDYRQIASIPVNGPSPTGSQYSYLDRLPGPGMYYYRIADVSLDGYKSYHGPLVISIGAPTEYLLGQNYPNPVGTSATTIKYALKAPGQTSLKIYNVLGEEVRTLVNGMQPANYYSIHWNGRNNGGQAVSNGIYFYKLSSGDFKATKKLMVLR